MPESQGQEITPAGFYRPQISGSSGGNHIVFSDGTVIDSKYFDYVNKTVKPDKWTTAGTGGAPAVQAYKDGKLVGLIMPMRDPNVPAALLQRP